MLNLSLDVYVIKYQTHELLFLIVKKPIYRQFKLIYLTVSRRVIAISDFTYHITGL